MLSRIESKVQELITEILAGSVIELIDVEYVKEKDWYLRVFIDKSGGIEIDDCQNLSEQLGKKLDSLDIIEDNYILEVSSPGLDRVLKNEKDFVREQGKMIDVKLYEPIEGKKVLTGKLLGHGDSSISLDSIDSDIALDKIAQIRLHIDI